MAEQKYEVKGKFLMGEGWVPYTKVIAAPNEKQAEDARVVIGSKHNLKRRYIKVDAVSLAKTE